MFCTEFLLCYFYRMRTLGLIGGTSWVSTIDYYTYINKMVNARLGGIASAKLLLYSMNMEELFKFGNAQDWNGLGNFLADIANKLEREGAEALLLCANTPHIAADIVQKNISIPLIHIVDETAKEIKKKNLKKIILLGTKITMEQDFFKYRLKNFGIETIIPEDVDREFIQTSIFAELGKNIFLPETKKRYLEIIARLQKSGGEGVILGCTEIPLLIKQEDCSIPAFDTTLIHSTAAVEFMLAPNP
jgi:aspartate racemase